MRLLRCFSVILDRVLDTATLLAGVLVIFTMVSVNWAVSSRYFFNRPIGWEIEVNSYALVYITFLAAAWLQREDGHVIVDVLLVKLNLRAQSLLNGITSIIGAIACLLLTWYGVRVTLDDFQTGYFTPTLLAVPRFILIAVVFVGSFLLSLEYVRRAYRNFAKFESQKGTGVESRITQESKL